MDLIDKMDVMTKEVIASIEDINGATDESKDKEERSFKKRTLDVDNGISESC